MPEEELAAADTDDGISVEDFIKELEEKERDLHITADLSIEIADLDIVDPGVQQYFESEIKADSGDVPAVGPASDNGSAPDASDGRSAQLRSRNHELESEVAALKVRVMELKSERNEIQEKSDRRLKDFENYKYRMDRERRGAFIDQIGNLAAQMLPVLDNLHRAIDAVPTEIEENNPAFKQFYDGIVLVSQQVNEVLAGMGVEPVKAVGAEFDPNFHEAVAAETRDDVAPNTVTDELLPGFRIGNRVIRHSMVKVATRPSGTVAHSSKSSAPQAASTPVSAEIETTSSDNGLSDASVEMPGDDPANGELQ